MSWTTCCPAGPWLWSSEICCARNASVWALGVNCRRLNAIWNGSMPGASTAASRPGPRSSSISGARSSTVTQPWPRGRLLDAAGRLAPQAEDVRLEICGQVSVGDLIEQRRQAVVKRNLIDRVRARRRAAGLPRREHAPGLSGRREVWWAVSMRDRYQPTKHSNHDNESEDNPTAQPRHPPPGSSSWRAPRRQCVRPSVVRKGLHEHSFPAPFRFALQVWSGLSFLCRWRRPTREVAAVPLAQPETGAREPPRPEPGGATSSVCARLSSYRPSHQRDQARSAFRHTPPAG